jgi:hypothetical protein
MSGIQKVLAAEAGSATAVAAKISEPERRCTRQVIEHWVRNGYVPGKWAPRVNAVYGIPLHELNPHIYPAAA